MFSLLANDTAESVRDFLTSVLPEISPSWWSTQVLPTLSFQQQRMVEERGISSLSGLDLAALLRILDKNWFELSSKRTLTNEVRTWTREMQHIRNKWAHAAGHPPEAEDVYRDLDTLQRFLNAINASAVLIESVKARKMSCLNNRAQANSNPVKAEKPLLAEQPKAETVMPFSEFVLGDMVYLKADPSVTGAVIQVILGQPENRYMVFAGNKPVQYYASQLAKLDLTETSSNELIPLENFHALLTAMQLQHPSLANLYSLHAARVDYIPYQFKPVIKLIRSDRPRILIADEVGVGKTIEAGLILRELQSRSNLESVLIICPRPLVTEHKWRNEMKRFDEEFVHLDGPNLRFCIDETDKDGCWPSRYTKAILPFSLFNEDLLTGSDGSKKRKIKGLLDLDPLPHFDLVIVDEAHHLRNPGTWLHRGVDFLCSNAEAVVFLSATPVQLGSDDLYVLLNLLRPDLIIDNTVYQHMSAPNPSINQAIELARRGGVDWQLEAAELLQIAVETDWGKSVLQYSPDFQRIYDLLTDHDLDADERIAFIRDAEKLHTFASIINRTRRRDIGAFTTRKPDTVEVAFSPQQQKLHDDLMEVQAQILQKIHGDKNLKFMMTTIRRQAASCIYGLAPFLKDILNRRIDVLELDEIDPEIDDFSSTTTLGDKIHDIIRKAEKLDPFDPKLDALVKVITGKQKMANNKILLFSSFRHTLSYLLENLQLLDLRIGYIHGGTPDEDRRLQRNKFSLPREDSNSLDILLSSEVGCEGLDYQFCDCLINYDLPWNPMRVEQRIGRIDRYGQKSESVAIYNLITTGTVDADIYHRCLWRIGVFRAALGGSEEIIGRLTEEIREVAENLSLSSDERQARLQQIADNEIRIVQEQAELEEQQSDLFGLRVPQNHQDDEVQKAASFWLTPSALQRLIQYYLEEVCGRSQEYILGEKPLKTLRVSQEGREAVLSHYKTFPKKTTPLYRDWEKWLKGNNQHLSIAFDAKCAAENRDAVFVTPIHPLALQAASAINPKQTIHTAFKVSTSDLKPGNYPFAIYHWQKKGIREDVSFQPVCRDLELITRFLTYLEQGETVATGICPIDLSEIDSLDVQHHGIWSSARLEHISQNMELVRFRRESLKTSHAARIAVLNEQISKTNNDKIRLMRKSQLESAENDFARRIVELEQAENQAEITAHPVAFGVMIVA